MAFSFGYSPWLLALSLLLAGGLSYWSYRSTVPTLSPAWRWTLGSLRFASLALICFLLLEPVVRHLNESEHPPLLAVLVDDTESMRVVGGEADTTAASVRDRLRPSLSPLIEDLNGRARFFAFDASLRELTGSPVDSLVFDGSRSDVAAALQAVTEELEGENLQGIALVSDGQHNSGRSPVRVADRSPVPVHTVTVGDTTRQRDLQVRRVAANDLAYVDTDVPVQATLRADDVEGTSTTVSLLHAGAVLDTVTLSLPSGTSEQTVDLSYRPDTPGLKQLTVQASPVPGEATTRNNERSVSQRVLASERRILLLGAAPSPSFAALRRVLERDDNADVTARIPQQDGSFYEGPFPDSLSRYDVIVNAGFPSSSVPDDLVRRIADELAEGTPALFVLDRQTDVSAWQERFSDVLPAHPSTDRLRFAEASFSPAETERSHPIFQIDDVEASLYEQLPPLAVPTSAWTPTPDATVLAEARPAERSESDPLLVVRRRTGHRTALLLGTDTWRWATLSPDLEAADPLWPGLVSNLLRWVATQDDDRPVRVRPAASPFEGDEPVEFIGQVYDESQNPVSDASVSVTLTDSAGTESPHSMDPVGNGRYELDVAALPEGTYQYEATARRDGDTLGSDQGQFSVEALRLEYQTPRADPVLMRQIASRSGGRAYATDDGSALSADLNASTDFTSTTVTESTETELWHTSIFLVVILLLLAVEWTLRKRFGLT